MSIEYEYIYIYCVVHKTYAYLTWGHFFSHGTPVWPWPVIQYIYCVVHKTYIPYLLGTGLHKTQNIKNKNV